MNIVPSFFLSLSNPSSSLLLKQIIILVSENKGLSSTLIFADVNILSPQKPNGPSELRVENPFTFGSGVDSTKAGSDSSSKPLSGLFNKDAGTFSAQPSNKRALFQDTSIGGGSTSGLSTGFDGNSGLTFQIKPNPQPTGWNYHSRNS